MTIKSLMNLKNQLKTYIKERNLTATELCRRAKVPRSTLTEWLSGRSPKDMRKLKRVADVLEISIDWLCYGNGLEPKATIEDFENLLNLGTYELVLRKINRNKK